MRNICLLLICLLSGSAFAQENPCQNCLYEANKLLKSGQIQEAIALLRPCLVSNKISKADVFDATRLLSLCYIYDVKPDSADLFVRRMLHLRPNYQTYHYVDPRALTTLVNSYTVANTLDVGVQTGFAFSQANVLKSFAAAQTTSTYNPGFGLNVGALFEYHLHPRFSIISDPNLNSMSYEQELYNVAGSHKRYSEIITTLEAPLIARGYVHARKWHIFGQAGVQHSIWINSFADVQSTSYGDGSVLQSSTETTDYRVKGMSGFQFGLGFNRLVGDATLSITMRYKNFLPNVVVPEKRYDDEDFILSSQYIDSDFNLRSVGCSIGFQWPFLYSVKKK